MKYIGAHVSAEGGVENAPLNAMKIGAKAFALFTKNQKRWESPPLSEISIRKFKESLALSMILPDMVLPHDSYLINIANPDPAKREKSINALLDEANRTEQLGLTLLNFHPGSHLGEITEQEGLDLVADGMNRIISQTSSVILVIENTAGQGSNLGYKFEHLGYIISKINDRNRVGVCLDTCHTFVSGYDLRDEVNFNKNMEHFEQTIGFKYLKAMHLNDSLAEYASKKDRHNSIGKGYLGLKPFELIMNDSRFDNIPLILETIAPELWAEEINLLYSMDKRGIIKP